MVACVCCSGEGLKGSSQRTNRLENLTELLRYPLVPKLLHYITSLFRIVFPNYVIIFTLQNWFRIVSLVICFLALLQGIPCRYRITLHNLSGTKMLRFINR